MKSGVMSSQVLGPLSDKELLDAIIKFNAQLGEVAWYSVNFDSSFETVANEHTDYVRALIAEHGLLDLGRPARFLEVAPYLHTTAQALNRDFGVEAAACDISPNSLRIGERAFRKDNQTGKATLVTSDFHELPFEGGYFDLVFIASAVHHTLRPEKVISELLRVTRPGGRVVLYNEPVKADGCFYSFRSNRRDDFTDWEKSLNEAGLLKLVSSPFLGSRCEQLFGMVENDRIPLDIFLNSGAVVEKLDLLAHPCELDKEFAAKQLTAPELAADLCGRLAPFRCTLGEAEQLMNFALPTDAEVSSFASRYCSGLAAIRETDGNQEARARLYGASLRMILRKPENVGVASDRMLKKEMNLDEGVFVAPAVLDRVRIRLNESSLPPLAAEFADTLQKNFPAEDWQFINQGNVYAQCLIGSSGRVRLPRCQGERHILLLRYFAVAHPEGIYWVDVCTRGDVLESAPICRSESRLFKILLPDGCSEIEIKVRSHTGKALKFHLAVRVAYLDVIEVEHAI